MRSFINAHGKGMYAVAAIPLGFSKKEIRVILNTVSETDPVELELIALNDILEIIPKESNLIIETINRKIQNLLNQHRQGNGSNINKITIASKLYTIHYSVELGDRKNKFYMSDVESFDEFNRAPDLIADEYPCLSEYPIFTLTYI